MEFFHISKIYSDGKIPVL